MDEEKGLGDAFADPEVFANPNGSGAFEPGHGEGQGGAAAEGAANGGKADANQGDGGAGQTPDGGAGGADPGGKSGKGAAQGDGESQKQAGFDRAAWDKFAASLDQSLGLDTEALKGFGELSEKLGLSAAKAKDMLNFAVEEGKRYQSRLREATEKTLREEMGRDFDSKISGAKALIERVDRELGDKAGFARIIEASGLGNNPDFVRGMIKLSSLLSEDSLGEAAAAGYRVHEETPYEGLKNFFK